MDAPRRIVTGHDASGRSVFLSDGPAPRSLNIGTAVFHELWLTDTMPVPIGPAEAGEPVDAPVYTAPEGPAGTVLRFTDISPGARTPMHRTRSVDYGIVLEGEIWLQLDDGSETLMRPGDVAIQRGTNHAWENRTTATVRMVFVLVSGAFADDLTATIGAQPELFDMRLDED